MTQFLFSDFGTTALSADVTTTPAAGTVETWAVLSSAGSPPLPQIGAGQVYPAVIFNPVTDYTYPEIVLVESILSSTSLSVSRGYNGVVKTHSNGDVLKVSIPAEYLNQLSLGGFGLLALGTVTTSSVLSTQAGVYTIVTATTTANDTCAFTLPPAVGGYGFRLYITNPASGVQVPTFNAASGETFAWLSPLEWDSTPGALNIIDFESTVNGAWDGAPVTSGLGPSAPLQEQQAAYSPSANGTVTIPTPLVTPYITQNHITLPAGASTNPISFPTPTTANAGASFSVWVDQPSAGVAVISFTGGTIRWVGGSAPSAPAAGKRLWMAFTNVDGTTWDGVIVSTGY